MAYLLTFAVSIVVFGTVILVHEGGHFLAARHFGIHVEEFSVGFGPAILKKRKNGTLFTLRLLPLGGYNMLTPPEQDAPEDADGQPPAPAAQLAYDPHKPPLPLTADGRSFNEASPWQRFFVIFAGAGMNFVAGFLVLLMLIGSQDAVSSKVIYDFTDNAQSEATGLQPNDEIISVNGHYCFVIEDVFYELQRTQNYTASLTVMRDGALVSLPAVTFTTTTYEDGSTGMMVDFRVYGIARTPLSVVKGAARYFCYYARSILRSFADLATGRVSVNQLSGPVGVVSAVSQAVSYGWEDVLSLAALLTINLGIFNLLPVPALDGCKLLFLAWEGVTRRPVPEKVQAAVNTVGMVALLTLMIFITMQDVSKFF